MEVIGAVVLGLFGLVGWANYLKNQRYKAAAEAKTDRFNKIVDRFSADSELLTFLQSKKGLGVLMAITSTHSSPKMPILVAASIGIVASFMGLGAFVLMLTFEPDMIFPAAFISSFGVGMLCASAFSYHLANKWRLFSQEVGELPGEEA